MARRIVKVEPGPDGVGQTVTFDDGSTEFDAFATATVDPDPAAIAEPDREVDATDTRQLRPPVPSTEAPVVDPMTGIPVATAEQQAPTPEQAANAARVAEDPVKAWRQPSAPAAPSGKPGNEGKPFELLPGAADEAVAPQPNIAIGMNPGSAGGFQPAAKAIKGYSEGDRAALGQGALDNAQREVDTAEAEIGGQEEYLSGLETRALNQYLQAESQALAIAADQKRNQIVQHNIQTKMNDVSKFRPNRTELFEGTAGGFRAVLAAIGMIAGGALSGINGGPNYAADAVFKMIDDNVRDQVAQNTAIYQNLVQRLGDEQAAAEVLRAKHASAVADMTKALELTEKTKERKAALAGARQRAELQAAQSLLKAQEALAPQETLQMAYRAPTPASVFVIDRDQKMLEQLGVDQKQTQDFMKEKISGQQNAKTVGEAIQYMKELDQDAATLRALAAANGGVLPGKDQILSPTQSPTMRAALAKLGIEHDVAASEAYKIINGLVMRRAKSYGGAITESDLKAAEGEVGVTSGQVLDFMTRMRGEANGQLRAQAYGYFQGRAQPVLDILLQGIGNTTGFKAAGIKPRK